MRLKNPSIISNYNTSKSVIKMRTVPKVNLTQTNTPLKI